ncbi:hypothetical protein [Roseibium sp.]|uniref:hypothetical protein n=1 Tax=Roseibium sp. TaxID=1936156 RepID=UPI003BAD3CC8
MAKPFFPFEETIICATGLIIGAIVAAGFKEAQIQTPQKHEEQECSCNEYELLLNKVNVGRLDTELTLEVLL